MNTIVNPEMIRLAREARGLTQTELARRAGVGQATISKIEAGVLDVSAAVVTAIAAAVEMPVTFFYQNDPIYGAGTSEFFHRKRQSVPVGVLNQVHAHINIVRLHVARLLRAVDVPPCRIPMLDVGDFKGKASEVARAVRAALSIASGPIPNMVKVIEDAGGLVIPCAFGTYEVDAISRWIPGLPPLFFVNVSAPVDRFRMNLAHELAHMVMHRVPEPDMEEQANQFAAEFLMPALEIRHQLVGVTLARLASLKPYWRTSMGALLKRASDLNTVSETSARYLWMHMAKRGYRKREPAELDLSPEKPTLLQEVIDFHRRELGYSISDLARSLAVTESDLIKFYRLDVSRPERTQLLRVVK